MNILRKLFGSRKFVTGLAAIAVSVLVIFKVEEALATKIVTAVLTMAALYIGGTALEDFAEKLGKK